MSRSGWRCAAWPGACLPTPPPKPTTQSWSPAWSAASAASTEATVGSGTVSEKIFPRTPVAVSLSSTASDSIRFYTKTKTVTQRWPSGIKSGAEFAIPTMR